MTTELEELETRINRKDNCRVDGEKLKLGIRNMNTASLLPGAPPADKQDRFVFPFDLGEWVDRKTLLKWIEENINALNWDNPELVEYLKRHPNYRPKELLTLLSFCYLSGVFESAVIEEQSRADETCRAICGDSVLTRQRISQFRRDNRGLLKWIVAEVLKAALREKYALGDTLFPAGVRGYLTQVAGERLDLARHFDRAGHEF